MERVVWLSNHTHSPLGSLPVAGSYHSLTGKQPFPPKEGAHLLLKAKAACISFPSTTDATKKWRRHASFLGSLLTGKRKDKNRETLKYELLEAIAPLERGADASSDEQENIEQIVRDLESVNLIKEPLNSDLLNGKWELLYTTSRSVLGSERPKFLRPNGTIYQAINVDTLRAQNMETWPFFNQVTANLKPLNARRVAVMFDTFKILGVIPIKAPGRARGELEITYLDDELRVSRGDKGNLFILKMVDPSYRVPL